MNPWIVVAIVIGAIILMTPKTALAYVKGVPTQINVKGIGGGFVLRTDAADAFLSMKSAASDDGIELQVNTAFRTMEEQTELYDKFKAGTGNTAARPGFSNHQNGIAVDIAVSNSWTSDTYKWLSENAYKYGFDNAEGQRVNEPWHWVYTAGA